MAQYPETPHELTVRLTEIVNEVEQIYARHNGVHTLYAILVGLRDIQRFAHFGMWNEIKEQHVRSQLARARIIDKTGFDPQNKRVLTYRPSNDLPSR